MDGHVQRETLTFGYDPLTKMRKVWNALQRFGAPLFDLKIEDLRNKEMVFQMGLPPNRIDIITSIDGVTPEDAWNNLETIEIYGIKVPLIGKAELLRNKKATGRPKDQLDVLWMEGEYKN